MVVNDMEAENDYQKIFLLDEGSLKELNSLFVLLELGGNR